MPIQISDAHSDSPFAQRQTGLIFNLPVPDPDTEQLPEGISLCMIVKNEERFLAACLDSVKGVVDEINIVDTGSTDSTVEIARAYGANVAFREWRNDFSWARNESLALATRRWTFVLDADEELAKESVALVRALRTTPAALTVAYINVVNIVDDPMGLGTMSHRLVRLFPTHPRIRFTNVIHESLRLIDGEMTAVISPVKIIHKGYTGEMLRDRDKDSRNRPLVSRAYEENSDDLFALFNFGNSAIASGDVDLGVEVLERMLATADRVRLYFPLAYLLLGQSYVEHYRDFDKALAILDTGFENFPHDAGIVFTRGQVYAKQGKYDEARAAYEQALNMREFMAYTVMTDEEIFEWKVFYAMAAVYEREGNFAEAARWIDRALENKPASFQLHRAKARMLENIGQYYDAEAGYRRIADIEPAAGNVELVNFLLRRKRFTDAIAIVQNEAHDAGNDQAVTELNLAAARGMIEQNLGDPLPYLEAALRLSPGHGAAISLAEQWLTTRGDVLGLERLHRAELEAPLTRGEDYLRRSFRMLALNKNDEALAIAERGLAMEPRNPRMHFNAGLALLRLGQEDRAAREFERVDDSSVEVFPDAMQILASLLVKSGESAAAKSALARWIGVAAHKGDAVIAASKVLVGGGARGEARDLLEAHMAGDQRIALELAGMLLQDGDLQAAGRIAAQAVG